MYAACILCYIEDRQFLMRNTGHRPTHQEQGTRQCGK